MYSDLRSINTSQWTNIPAPLVQAINILVKSCSHLCESLFLVNKESWCSEISESITTQLTTLQKEQESKMNSKISSSFSNIQDKFASEMLSFKKNIRDAFDHMTEEVHNTKSQISGYHKSFKSEVVSLRDIVLSTKDSIKTELASKYIKPEQESLRLEFEDLRKTLAGHEKDLKLFGLQFDRFSHDVNGRLDNHRDEIKQNEREINTINKRFNYIVENTTETLRQNFEKYTSLMEESKNELQKKQDEFFDAFHKQREEIINVLEKRRCEMISIHENTKETYDKLKKDQVRLFERCDFLERDSKFQLENIKIEIQGSLLKTYEETKGKLLGNVNEELKLIKAKLDWLPATNNQMNDMSPIEARLFILESRLRREENNRIVQKIEIMKGDCKVELEDKSWMMKKSITPTANDESHGYIRFPKNNSRQIEKRRFKTPDLVTVGTSNLRNIGLV